MPKKPATVNGYSVGDTVLVRDAEGKIVEKRIIRYIGVAGFRVKGLATCFYWTEQGTMWDKLTQVAK